MSKKREKSAKHIKKTTKIFKKPEKNKKNIENSGQTDKYIEKRLKISKSWQKPPKIQRQRQIC